MAFRHYGRRRFAGRYRRSFGRSRRRGPTRGDAGPGQRGTLLGLQPADNAYSAAAITAIDSTIISSDVQTLFVGGGGTLPQTTFDFQVDRGYLDVNITNTTADAKCFYVLEYLLEPSEPQTNSGLQDVSFLNKKFLKKQMLGISYWSVPGHWGSYKRIPLSKASVLSYQGWKYIWQLYSADTYAINTVYVRKMGGKIYWDRIM